MKKRKAKKLTSRQKKEIYTMRYITDLHKRTAVMGDGLIEAVKIMKLFHEYFKDKTTR